MSCSSRTVGLNKFTKWRPIAVSFRYHPCHSKVHVSSFPKQLDMSYNHKIKTLVIDNYDSYTYNLYQLIAEVNGEVPVVVLNDRVTIEAIEDAYRNHKIDNIVISPGPGSPSEPNDIGICGELFLKFPNIPILGVCLGHEVLGAVHGATVKQVEPVHGRLSPIEHNGHLLFRDIISGSDTKAVRYHSLAIDENSLPHCLKPIAWSCGSHQSLLSPTLPPPLDSHSPAVPADSTLMAICHEKLPHFGVQFHPESIGTSFGHKLLENFRDICLHHRYGTEGQSSKLGNEFDRILDFSIGWKIKVPNIKEEDNGCDNSIVMSSSVERISDILAVEEEIEVEEEEENERVYGGWQTQLGIVWEKCEGVLSGKKEELDVIFDGLYKKSKFEDTFWLDSAASDCSCFSYMGGPGGALWQHISYELPDPADFDKSRKFTGRVTMRDSSNITNWWYGNFWNYLDDQVQRNKIRVTKTLQKDLPFDFWGGFVGYLGYELKSLSNGKNAYKSKYPDASLFFADRVLAIDHEKRDIYCLALYDMGVSSEGQRAWTTSTAVFIKSILKKYHATCSAKSKPQVIAVAPKPKFELKSYPIVGDEIIQKRNEELPLKGFKLDRDKEQYVRDIEKCKRALIEGESYEVCLTNTMRKKTSKLNARKLYRILRKTNPAPHAAWLGFGQEDLCVCCSSPERFLKGDILGQLEASPIKGTAARKADPLEDESVALALAASEKDQAENLMIVDLLRNDLGQVCEVGSVKVTDLMAVKTFATVHQLVSTIRGQLRSDKNPVEAIRSCFPPGSMTGAPKIRTTEIIDKIEGGPRGVYSGIIGYIGINGTFDFNVAIRTAVVTKDEISIGAGGAIVTHSDAAAEYEEMLLKAKAIIRAVSICNNLSQ